MSPSPSSPMRSLALCSIIFIVVMLMLPNVLWLGYGYRDINVWINAAIVPSILLLALFALLGDVVWFACLLLIPFVVMAPMEAFYIGNYHHPTFPEILATIFASNPREIREYLGDALLPLSLCALGLLAVAPLATWWIWRAQLRWRHSSRAWVLTLAIVTPAVIGITTAATASGDASVRLRQSWQTMTSLTDPIQYGYPFGMLQRFTEYRHEWSDMRAAVARKKTFRFHATRIASRGHRRQVYVLVIGEASRRDHWQLFGYGGATNPELSHTSNLVPIPDMVSSWPESITAIPMIITRKPLTMKAMNWPEASILRAMGEAGYETWWISNQMPIGTYDSPVSAYAYEAQHVEFLNHTAWSTPGTYDDDLLQPLHDALQASDRDAFIVLHLMGSHQRYDFRYPASYRRFRPTESDPVDGSTVPDRARNSYDNSILFTDHILATVIGMLRGSNAVAALWYESDHGESLPTSTCKLEGHGNGTRYEYEISALFWASDFYISEFPTKLAAIRANAGKRTLGADTFESLIDMANTTYPGRDASRSLFDPQWRYRARTVNYPWQVNIDDADFGKGCQMVLPPNG